jgi:hypothetical protein
MSNFPRVFPFFILLLFTSLSQAELLTFQGTVETPIIVDRSSSYSYEYAYDYPRSFTYDTITGDLVMDVSYSGSIIPGDPLIDLLFGNQTWEVQERITLETMNPFDTGTREVLSCQSYLGAAEDVCSTAYAMGIYDFGLTSMFWDLEELHITASSEIFNSQVFPFGPSITTIDYVVPVPASIWLFGSALLGLAGNKRLSRR